MKPPPVNLQGLNATLTITICLINMKRNYHDLKTHIRSMPCTEKNNKRTNVGDFKLEIITIFIFKLVFNYYFWPHIFSGNK